MAYYNLNDHNFHPTPSTFQEFDAYSSQSQIPVVKGFNGHAQTHEYLSNNWGMITQPGPRMSEWVGLHAPTGNDESVAPATSYATEVDSWHQSAYAQNDWPEMVEQAQPEHTGYSYEDASFVGTATQETYTVTPGPGNDESVAPATSYATEVDSWRQPAYAQSEWPEIIEQAQPHYTGYSNQGTSFVGTTTQGTYSATPGPSSIPLDYSGETQCGPSAAVFDWTGAGAGCPIQNPANTLPQRDVQAMYRRGSGSTRTQLVLPPRYQPYGKHRARANKHRNAEAGPSTLVQPPTPYVAPLTPQPSGEISETTADAETNQTIEEGEVTLVDEKASTEKPCRDSYRLRDWVRRWNKPERFPEMADALAAAVDVISTLRTQVYALPCLHVRKGNSGPNPQSSKHAQDVWEAGEKQRMHFRELSRYYKLEPRKAKWKREPLLKKVLDDLEDLDVSPEYEDWSEGDGFLYQTGVPIFV